MEFVLGSVAGGDFIGLYRALEIHPVAEAVLSIGDCLPYSALLVMFDLQISKNWILCWRKATGSFDCCSPSCHLRHYDELNIFSRRPSKACFIYTVTVSLFQ